MSILIRSSTSGFPDVTLPDSVSTLGDAIRLLRESRGLTMRALATAIDVSPAFLCDLEHGRRNTVRLAAVESALYVKHGELSVRYARPTNDLLTWLRANPKLVSLLNDIRASGHDPLTFFPRRP